MAKWPNKRTQSGSHSEAGNQQMKSEVKVKAQAWWGEGGGRAAILGGGARGGAWIGGVCIVKNFLAVAMSPAHYPGNFDCIFDCMIACCSHLSNIHFLVTLTLKMEVCSLQVQVGIVVWSWQGFQDGIELLISHDFFDIDISCGQSIGSMSFSWSAKEIVASIEPQLTWMGILLDMLPAEGACICLVILLSMKLFPPRRSWEAKKLSRKAGWCIFEKGTPQWQMYFGIQVAILGCVSCVQSQSFSWSSSLCNSCVCVLSEWRHQLRWPECSLGSPQLGQDKLLTNEYRLLRWCHIMHQPVLCFTIHNWYNLVFMASAESNISQPTNSNTPTPANCFICAHPIINSWICFCHICLCE